MTRTQRRRAARTNRQTQDEAMRVIARTRRAEAAALLSEEEWDELVWTLERLLYFEFPSPFTNLQLFCPKEVWLVVDLTRVRPSTAFTPGLRHEIIRVLNALTRLLVHTETLRPWCDSYSSFWRRVLTSEMVQSTPNDDPMWIRGFIRYVRAKGSHVAFQWRGRPMDPTQVMEPLIKCLQTDISGPMTHYRCVQVALRFEDCQLTHKNLLVIHHLLKMPMTSHKILVYSKTILRELSLSSNKFDTQCLHDIATMLEDTETRRIDGFKLDNSILGDSRQQTSAYTTALRRVMRAAVTTMPSRASVPDAGVALSLEYWTIHHVDLIDALASCLQQATRPIRALSFNSWQIDENDAFDRFARLLLTDVPTVTSEFDLNASCIQGPETYSVRYRMQDARYAMLEEALPRIVAAAASGKRMSCRRMYYTYVSSDANMETDIDMTNFNLNEIDYYIIHQVTDDGRMQIAIPSINHETEQLVWVWWTAVANICIDGTFLLLCGPFGLIVDHYKPECRSYRDGETVTTEMIETMGGTLARLSMRDTAIPSQQYVTWCPKLQEFTSSGCYTWTAKDPVGGQSLLVATVPQSQDASALPLFLALPKLRYLSFAYNWINIAGLEAIYATLKRNRYLEYVDIRHVRYDPGSKSHQALRSKIDSLLEYECLDEEAWIAFHLVLRSLESIHEWYFSTDIIDTIMTFGGHGPKRIVLW